MSLGLDRLKSALMALGLKCGGYVLCTNYTTCTVEYRQSAPPIFTLGWQERGGGGGRINGSDRFCTRGAPPILISAPRSTVCVRRPWRAAAVDK